MSNAATQTAHDFISSNAPNERYDVDDSTEVFETRVRNQYERDEVTVDETCYPVLVFQNNEGPFAWFDCERRVGYNTKA